ncbi:MAG: flavin-containing monooxygenase, partial [Candidatus Dormibacteraceae bacterium]
WRVVADGSEPERFDAVVIATGHLNEPRWPELPGVFAGSYLHSAQYRQPNAHADERVCIMGIGNSACDIACDLALIAQRVVVSTRTGTLIWPKWAFGFPLTRLQTRFEWPFLPPRIRTWLYKTASRLIVWMIFGSMKQYGITLPTKKTHPTSNQFFLSHVKYRRITVKPGIEAIDGSRITFTDGTCEEFDSLIAATGYTVRFPFFKPELLNLEDTKLPFYKRVVPVNYRGLYFIGYFNLDSGLPPVFERQAQWVADLELGRCVLPPPEEMEADIERRQRELADKYLDRPRLNLEEEFMRYKAAIAAERRRRPRSDAMAS